MEQLIYDIILSEDGSHTVQIKNTEITFHSTKGAIRESNHVFINAGLDYFVKQNPGVRKIRIFEIGFGTGLNALLTAREAPRLQKNIEYYAIDLHPLPDEIFSKLNYGKLVSQVELYQILLLTGWNQLVFINPFFKLHKIEADLNEYQFKETFDIIYFDAFAPEDAPELWTSAIFEKLIHAMNHGAVLVTYCSKSKVRRDLTEVGFYVEKLEGPPGKREIIRALKI